MNTRIWSLFEAIIYYLAYLASGLIARLLLLIYHSIRLAFEFSTNHMIFDNQLFFEQVINTTEQNPLLIVLLANFIILILYIVLIRCRGEKFKTYAALGETGIINILGAISTGICLHYLLSFLILNFFSTASAMQQYNTYISWIMHANIWMIMTVVILIAPIVEEIVFRGVMFRAISRSINTPVAIIVTALLFAIAHGDPVQIAYAFILGIVLAIVRSKSKRIIPCIALHIAFNSTNFLYKQDIGIAGVPWYVVIPILIISFWLTIRKNKV